ncbi:MAG: hypothetical protein Kow00105_08720 [Phycisphaeraceae bacterium]
MGRSPMLSRRELLFGRLRAGLDKVRPPEEAGPDEPKTAVIQGRHCLAYRSLMCSTCFERCPEPGAIVIEQGIPQVVPDKCTGCGECRDVCPSPTNAILMLPARRPGGPDA